MLVPQERSTRGEQGSVRNFSLIVFAQHESRQEPRGGLQRPANSVGSTIRRIEGVNEGVNEQKSAMEADI